MICPTCKVNKPRREFRLRVRYDETKPRYGIACNECRSKNNHPVSSSVKMTDAYVAWLVHQTSWTDPATRALIDAGRLPELVAERRKQLTHKRLVKSHASTQRFFAAAAVKGIIKA